MLLRRVASSVLLVAASAVAPAAGPDDRLVADQRRVEEVYWRYTDWPKANPTPKPALDSVFSDAALRSKVALALRKSEALRDVWGRVPTHREIQDELNRMARSSRRPAMLAELFAALDDDPERVATTIARPIVVDRLLRSLFATDERIHGPQRAQAERALGAIRGIGGLSRAEGGTSSTRTWSAAELESDDGRVALRDLARAFGMPSEGREPEALYADLPPGRVSRLIEREDGFETLGITSKAAGGLTVRSARWTKIPLESWLASDAAQRRESVSSGSAATDDTPYDLPAMTAQSCTDDTWRRLAISDVPMPRSKHRAVWTGSVMIIHGGTDTGNQDATPRTARYDPATDTWSAGSSVNEPHAGSGITGMTAVWTGQYMVVWGGWVTSTNAGRYDPVSDTWLPVSTVNAPSNRTRHSAVWTGDRMIVWGGFINGAGTTTGTGGSYDPVSDVWTTIQPFGGGADFAAVWTGSEMIIFSGSGGAKYNPTANSWSPISNAPSGRSNFTTVWTGTEMIVWGGSGGTNSFLADGARYNPSTDTWTPTNLSGAPPGRQQHVAVWTGSRMIIWSGFMSVGIPSGGLYDPTTDSWTSLPLTGAPEIALAAAAVWTGTEMIVWGGVNGAAIDTGGRFDPASGTWRPVAFSGATVIGVSSYVWTGARAIFWGGSSSPHTGGTYDPTTDTWAPISLTGAPSAPGPAVWTGTRMLVWGSTANGGAYDPVADGWSPIAQAGQPQTRADHTLVWTGSRMIVWGGRTNISPITQLGDGRAYDPATNTWSAALSTNGAPSPRSQHVAVWTGKKMIVWGGGLTDGALYDPATDMWSPMAPVGPPRLSPIAVWTGRFMVMWGGSTGSVAIGNGGRYDPEHDIWFSMSGSGAPSARQNHRAVLAENQVLIWGGSGGSSGPVLGDGARYDDWADVWTPISTVGAATARQGHALVWTGERMLVAAGSPASHDTRDYCFVCTPSTWYRDADGDGAGYPFVTTSSCAQPSGYVRNTDDCDDADPNAHLGAPEICDGRDDDCNGVTPSNEIDADGDGYRLCANDCDDANPAVHPGAAEICNGLDDNCSGQFDDDALGVDTDGDGVRNACDNCRVVPNATQTDTDGDTVGNACDTCPLVADASQLDADGDTLGDVCDNCPLAPNLAQTDTDGDRAGDACDNCPVDRNSSQSDFDHDGEGDLCDLNDGLIYVLGTDDNDYVEWQGEGGPTSWNVYGGDLAVLRTTGVYTQTPGSNPLATRSCGASDLFVVDADAIASGKVKFTLVTGVQSGTEGSLGTNSAGSPRSNTNPCP